MAYYRDGKLLTEYLKEREREKENGYDFPLSYSDIKVRFYGRNLVSCVTTAVKRDVLQERSPY